ncbi:hypothetical protein SASPL_130417 [Salvia splendens]|uniref:DNA topoisomerase (ATP-hydrolyzing) n=1 Tax=Salvia splendens TaxID=180675 RepID=A0A8X8ZJW5_SALSN|nr:hypothetical protein SASPL_130417 [Salvia splendens]
MAGRHLCHNRFDLLKQIRGAISLFFYFFFIFYFVSCAHPSSSVIVIGNLIAKTAELTRSIVEDICGGRSPILLIDQFTSYCADVSGNCCCSYDLPNRKEILVLQRETQVRRLDLLLRVLLIVQQLLQENKHCSKRDIYYMHPSAFKEQSVVDRAINDICILLHCSRDNLNVVYSLTGLFNLQTSPYELVHVHATLVNTVSYLLETGRLVMGWLRFSEAGRKFDCIGSPNKTYHIPVQVEDVEVISSILLLDIISLADYILIVEKESGKNQGRGYPDIPTRRFLNLLVGTLHLPVYCLVDCDPYGIDILVTYRFGSMIRSCIMSVLHGTRSPSLEVKLSELQLLLDRGVKCEIEALSAQSLTFLSEKYLPSKIARGVHL